MEQIRRDPDRFAWTFGLDEAYPRGQLNGLMILSEIGERGAWTRVYAGRHGSRFDLPTVEGVDFPSLGISEARNDVAENTLWVSTYCATAAHRGQPTRWKVTQLADPRAVKVYRDDAEYGDWGVMDDTTIEINGDVEAHRYRIVYPPLETARRGGAAAVPTQAGNAATMAPGAPAAARYRPAAPRGCACC